MSQPSNIVFVGNIPFELTEEQLSDIFSEVGPVVKFKLVFHHDTGKPRGYGFCEYADIETASSAIRNHRSLGNGTDHDVNSRKLRLDFADPMVLERQFPNEFRARSKGYNTASAAPANKLRIEQINTAIDSLTSEQKIQFLAQMKDLANSDPNRVRLLLNQSPQMAYSLFHTMASLELIDGNIIRSLVGPGIGDYPQMDKLGNLPKPPAPPVPAMPNLPISQTSTYSQPSLFAAQQPQQQYQPPPMQSMTDMQKMMNKYKFFHQISDNRSLT
ncbi:hypothetical protein H4219_001529 [Mycoemilia scoparia]|uniref:RRM domain-containing protein n=1 Tax=Mycoemilia scoparia TaxID=417184 RepID=A0A9W8A0T9_9FUNG|nr:hypothetical protein H4219_001529 [Mycoemilia scoparia]